MGVTIFTNALIVCLDPQLNIIPNGHLIVKNGIIDEITSKSPDFSQYPGAEVINMTNRVILPGLFNAHTHISMAPFRGIVHDRKNVLYDIVWPIESALTAEDCYHLARLGALEALKAGSTCVADHYFYMDSIARGILDIGIRGVVGETIMDMGGPFSHPESLERGMQFWEKWHRRHPLITPVLAPHGPDTVSAEALAEIRTFCEEKDTRYHMHLAQTQHEIDIIRQRYGLSSVEYLASIDILGPRLAAAHCIFTDATDVSLLSQNNSSVLYCPSTHAFTGHVAPVQEMVEANINVCLGTDFVAENDDHNMLEEMRLATMLQKVVHKNPESLPTAAVIKMATNNGPRAYGLNTQLGSLEVGKAADLIAIDLKNPRLTPHYNIVNTVVYAANEADIDCVMVDGKILIQDKKTVGIDEEEIIREGQKTCDRILAKALASRPALAQSIDSYIITQL